MQQHEISLWVRFDNQFAKQDGRMAFLLSYFPAEIPTDWHPYSNAQWFLEYLPCKHKMPISG